MVCSLWNSVTYGAIDLMRLVIHSISDSSEQYYYYSNDAKTIGKFRSELNGWAGYQMYSNRSVIYLFDYFLSFSVIRYLPEPKIRRNSRYVHLKAEQLQFLFFPY